MLITYQSKLLKRTQLSTNVNEFVFSRPDDTSWSFNAGQYMIFHIPQASGHPARRLYSIATSPLDNSSLGFIIELVPNGIGSTHLAKMNVNDSLTMQGPAGVFTYRKSDRDGIFLATGTGIAPMLSIICTLVRNPSHKKKMHLFWGLKTSADAYYLKDLDNLTSAYPLFQFCVCFSREANLKKVVEPSYLPICNSGRVNVGLEDMLKRTNTQFGQYDYYLCGSKHVVDGLRQYCSEKLIPNNQVFFEKFN